MEKHNAHQTPNLHRAFSVFLINSKGEILIQKRANDKYHSPGLWTNACCSHPQKEDESIANSAEKRLYEELGICDVKLKELFSFIYYTKFKDDLYEYENDTVLIGRYDGDIFLDPSEASEYKWISKTELSKELTTNPKDFTVWFLSCAPRVLNKLTTV